MANGIVERFHRTLKASLIAHDDRVHWSVHLPLVLLGLRTAFKEDIGCSAAQLVYGAPLRLPGELITPADHGANSDPASYATQLTTAMRALRATPPRPQRRKSTYVSNELAHCTHVFVRHDACRQSLQHPYDGPFRVIERRDKYFLLDLKGRKDTVSIDRLKPAYLDTPFASAPPTTSLESRMHTGNFERHLPTLISTTTARIVCDNKTQKHPDRPKRHVTWAPLPPQLGVFSTHLLVGGGVPVATGCLEQGRRGAQGRTSSEAELRTPAAPDRTGRVYNFCK